MRGYGEWIQLSVFQYRLDRIAPVQLEASLVGAIDHYEDHVLIVDIGPAESVAPKVGSLGKTFEPIERKATVVRAPAAPMRALRWRSKPGPRSRRASSLKIRQN